VLFLFDDHPPRVFLKHDRTAGDTSEQLLVKRSSRILMRQGLAEDVADVVSVSPSRACGRAA
jgi:hypothetical protein